LLTITDSAKKYIESLGSIIILCITKKGCAGHEYNFYKTDKVYDNILMINDTFGIFEDAKSILNNSVVDYVETPLKSSLKVINPNEQSRCGCGESFLL